MGSLSIHPSTRYPLVAPQASLPYTHSGLAADITRNGLYISNYNNDRRL